MVLSSVGEPRCRSAVAKFVIAGTDAMDQHPEVAREPREIELKLEIEPGALDAVRRHPRLAGADERTATLRATYFDTPDARLREAGIALRIRDEDGRRVQTVKAMRGPAGLLFDRAEWETEVEGEALDLSAAKGTALEPLLSEERLRRALKPAFTVETRRTTLSIEDGEAVMEVVLDQGEIRAGRRRAPFLEVELELTAGDPRVLFDLAEALAADLPVKVGHLTKSERGYALLRRQPLKAVKAEPVALVPGQSVGEAMQAIARNCLTQLVRNEAVLAAAPQPAAVHQARVALRRFRA
jgi:triphosphatase